MKFKTDSQIARMKREISQRKRRVDRKLKRMQKARRQYNGMMMGLSGDYTGVYVS